MRCGSSWHFGMGNCTCRFFTWGEGRGEIRGSKLPRLRGEGRAFLGTRWLRLFGDALKYIAPWLVGVGGRGWVGICRLWPIGRRGGQCGRLWRSTRFLSLRFQSGIRGRLCGNDRGGESAWRRRSARRGQCFDAKGSRPGIATIWRRWSGLINTGSRGILFFTCL